MSGGPVWVNGSFEAQIDPLDRGLLLGDGVFDTLVSLDRIPFAGERHIERLLAHAAAIGIALDAGAVRDGWRAVIDAAEARHVILRTTVTRGVTARGLWPQSSARPTLMVSATPWSAALVGRPVKLVVSSVARNAGSPTSRLKTIGYLDNILAAREAALKGADDALLLNADRKVASSTIANVFVLSGGRLLTPPAADGVMAGIIRGLVLEIAPRMGVETIERSLETADILSADEAFLTNSVRLVSPVISLDGRTIGGRAPDSIVALLAKVADEVRGATGIDPRAG